MERSGGPGKGRNLLQNRGGQNQGRRHGHRAAQITRDTMQVHTPPASITKRTPPTKEHVMCTRGPQSGGAQGVDGRYNTRRSGAPGPHTHGNAVRQVVDDHRAEVRGQRKPSNNPLTTRRTPVGQLLGTANAQTAPAATSTVLVHQRLGSANTETTPAGSTGRSSRQNAATRHGMRSVRGPVTKQQPDGMSHGG